MKYYWHIHHETLCEFSDNIEERVAYIKNNKSIEEMAVRLRLLREVKGELPKAYKTACKAYYDARKAYNDAWKAYNDAWKAYYDAGKAYNDAWKACNDAWKAYNDAGKACKEEIEELHKKECPACPWDGFTIFPDK